jgi:glycosyltransferase involved in cell wall biosynthesis
MPYGVKVPPSIPVQAEARSYLDLPQDISVIFCATRFTEVGNSEGKTEMLVNLLRAFAEVPTKSLLVLVGDGPGRGHIERNILEQGLETRVRLLGAVENDAMKWFYAACDLYAYPHWLDRPWMSVLEAQAHGRPVVSMRTGSAEITVVDGRTGLLANSSDEFREHLAELTADRARCRAMGKEAQDYISKVHSIHVRVRQIEELMSQQPHSQTARGLGRLLTFNRTAR